MKNPQHPARLLLARLIFAARWIGVRNWYQGSDRPNAWQWLVGWRIGPGTAWALAKVQYPDAE